MKDHFFNRPMESVYLYRGEVYLEVTYLGIKKLYLLAGDFFEEADSVPNGRNGLKHHWMDYVSSDNIRAIFNFLENYKTYFSFNSLGD